jgi:hypothetical protein
MNEPHDHIIRDKQCVACGERFYRLTRDGRRQLQAETRGWEQTAAIIGR